MKARRRKARRILFVEDEAGLVLTVGDRLRAEGYELDAAADGDTGLRKATEGGYDLILLDVMLPGRSGFDVCRDLRRQGISTPVLMLTARGELVDKVLGLKLGADDYLTKPFEPAELLARIEAILRRSDGDGRAGQELFAFGEVRVDFGRLEVYRKGRPVDVSAKEFELLAYLVRRRGHAVSRRELLDEVWGYDSQVSRRTVDVHVFSLRKKLEPNPRRPSYIRTVHGTGYRFLDV